MEFLQRIRSQSPASSPSDSGEEVDPLADKPIESQKQPLRTKRKYVMKKRQSAKILSKEKLHCPECEAEFSSKSSLRKHKKIHKKFDCEVCGKSFNRQSNLKTHMRSHTQEKLFSCPNCNQKYAKKQSVDIHLNGGRCFKRPFPCTVCSRSFALDDQLKTHMKSHIVQKIETPTPSVLKLKSTSSSSSPKKNNPPSKSKPSLNPHDCTRGRFVCDQCFQDYTSKANLDSHLRTQHGGDKPFECPDCGRKFSLKTRLNFHRKIHTGVKPHLCPNCGKSFRLKAHLIVHERSHTGETPFKCLECNVSFYQRAHLNSHMMKHTGATPYSCPHCEKAYTRGQTLKIHIEKFHPTATTTSTPNLKTQDEMSVINPS